MPIFTAVAHAKVTCCLPKLLRWLPTMAMRRQQRPSSHCLRARCGCPRTGRVQCEILQYHCAFFASILLVLQTFTLQLQPNLMAPDRQHGRENFIRGLQAVPLQARPSARP